MELKTVSIVRSPQCHDRVRLCGEVSYDDKASKPEVYWFDVPEKYAEYLSESGNPWLVCLLPLAMTLGEPLRMGVPIDPTLSQNVQELMRIWKCWYPYLHIVPIEAQVVDAARQGEPRKTAAFFSGGVDSFFTVLRNTDGTESFRKTRIDELLCVWGFDVPLENGEAFRRMKSVLCRAASDLGKELIDVATNLRETTWRCTDWAHLSHNCAFASVALALGQRYSQVMIASSNDYRELSPWGSHVLTDPLLSTGSTKIIHDAPAYSRLQKVERVMKSDVALRSLRVCWRSRSDENCGACEKCYRTMLALELMGALGRCVTFDGVRMNVEGIGRILIAPDEVNNYHDMQALALGKGRRDIAQAIDRSLRNSARLRKWLDVIRCLRTKRFVWRWAQLLESALLARYAI